MSIEELKFRCRYFCGAFKEWMSNGAIFCKKSLYWNLTVDGKIVEEHVGSFIQFLKWIVTHETFDNL